MHVSLHTLRNICLFSQNLILSGNYIQFLVWFVENTIFVEESEC
jgi:hypothetical protein